MNFYKKSTFWLYLVFILFGIAFFTQVIINHYFFRTYTFDYGTYNFAFWDYAHFRIDKSPVYVWENMTFLQDHFSFTLFYLVPLYWIMNWLTGTYTLLIIQTTLILLSGWAVYKLIKNKTTNEWLSLAALLHYFLLFGRFSSFSGDCNIGIIASCMVPFFLYFIEDKKYIAASAVFLLALFSRENMPLWFIFICTVLAIIHRKDKKIVLINMAFIISSVIYFVLLFKVFIPMLETPDKKYSLFNYTALGENPSEAIVYLLKHPLESIKLLFINHSGDLHYNRVKFEFYYVYLLSGGLLLFYRPRYLIWFIPLVAQKMFNNLPIRWSIEWYYSIEVVTILPISVFLIIAEFKKTRTQYIVAVLICLLTLGTTMVKSNPPNREMGWWGNSKEFLWGKTTWNPGYNYKLYYRYLKMIPEDARVSSSSTLLPHLAQRRFIYQFPRVDDAEYLIALKKPDFYMITPNEYIDKLNLYINDTNWIGIADDESIILLKKK